MGSRLVPGRAKRAGAAAAARGAAGPPPKNTPIDSCLFSCYTVIMAKVETQGDALQENGKRAWRAFQGTFWRFFWRAALANIIFWGTGGIAAPIAFVLFLSIVLPQTQIEGARLHCANDDGFYKKWLGTLALNYGVIIIGFAAMLALGITVFKELFDGDFLPPMFRYWFNEEFFGINKEIIGYRGGGGCFGPHGGGFRGGWGGWGHRGWGGGDWCPFFDGSDFSFSDIPPRLFVAGISAAVAVGIGFLFTCNYAGLVLHRNIISRIYVQETATKEARAEFTGGYWSLLGIHILLAGITILTAGILFPLAVKMYRSYVVKNTTLPGHTMTGSDTFGSYYKQWVPLLLVYVVAGISSISFPPIKLVFAIVTLFFAYNWFFSGIKITKNKS